MLKPIPSFSGYFADDMGNIYSSMQINAPLHALKQSLAPNGYRHVALCQNGVAHTKTVHRLILETFIGECPKNKESCHNDGNRQNNNLFNLRWDTRKNNHADKKKHGTSQRGERNGMAKFNSLQVHIMRKSYKMVDKKCGHCNYLAIIFDANYSTINRIVHNETWKDI